MINDDGLIYVLGRKNDIVRRAGTRITSAALESCIDLYLKSQTCVLAVTYGTLGKGSLAIVKDLIRKMQGEYHKVCSE